MRTDPGIQCRCSDTECWSPSWSGQCLVKCSSQLQWFHCSHEGTAQIEEAGGAARGSVSAGPPGKLVPIMLDAKEGEAILSSRPSASFSFLILLSQEPNPCGSTWSIRREASAKSFFPGGHFAICFLIVCSAFKENIFPSLFTCFRSPRMQDGPLNN